MTLYLNLVFIFLLASDTMLINYLFSNRTERTYFIDKITIFLSLFFFLLGLSLYIYVIYYLEEGFY